MNGNQFLRPGGAAMGKLKQMQEAADMESFVREKAQRLGSHAPPYKLLELIGKGSFGRVYKSQRHGELSLVAVKIMDADSSDYNLRPAEKDQAIKDFITEISILRTLSDAKAKNVNTFYDAFSFHSQLWIISEYCPGGSVHTLMKASPRSGLEEKYIIPISRETAVALTFIHKAGIIHRDVKAANILITEDGKVQLCDFGVSGILENTAAKRSTIIGTPYWMAPELHSDAQQSYSTEVDCWAFGCTVYEMATGLPPNARVTPNMLHMALQAAPRLEGAQYSPALREFVSFCLQEQPEKRPSANDILDHPFVYNTSKKYPTNMLRQVIERFAQWEQSGGQRASLFNAYGAAGPSAFDSLSGDEDEWNFSTTPEFDQDMLSNYANSMEPLSKTTSLSASDRGSLRSRSSTIRSTTPYDRAMEEQRVLRGGRNMGRIFDTSAEPYEYFQGDEDTDPHDLPFRMLSSQSATRESIIDLDIANDTSQVPSLDSVDLATVKMQKLNRFYNQDWEESEHQRHELTSKRLTREWKFPESLTLPVPENGRRKTQDWTMAEAFKESEMDQQVPEDQPYPASNGIVVVGSRPTLKHTVTEPVGICVDYLHPVPAAPGRISLALEPSDRYSTIEIDPVYTTRPSTAASSTGESAMTDVTTGDPFELESAFNTVKVPQRTSFHAHSQSEPTPLDRNSVPALANNHHFRGDGSISSDSEYERNRTTSIQASVQASVDTLRQGFAEESDYWGKRFVPDLHARLDAAQSRHHLLSAPEMSSYANDIWTNYDADVTSTPTMTLGALPHHRTADTTDFNTISTPVVNDGLAIGSRLRTHSRGGVAPPLAHPDQRHNKLALTTIPPPLISPLPPPPPHAKPLSHYVSTHTFDSNSVNGDGHSHHTSVFSHTSSGSFAPSGSLSTGAAVSSSPEQIASAAVSFPPSDHFALGHSFSFGPVAFPEPYGPEPAALEEDANPELVISEVERLVEDFLVGLRVAGGLIGESSAWDRRDMAGRGINGSFDTMPGPVLGMNGGG